MNISNPEKNAQPLQSTSSSSPTAQGESKLAERLPLRILVAEDNLVNQKVVLQVLKRLGYSADVANNGLEVIEALKRQPYDVILMDVQMPQMDGIDATRHIRQDEKPQERLSIIAVTANTMQGQRDICLEAGMDDYLTKPLRSEQLAEALSKCCPPIS